MIFIFSGHAERGGYAEHCMQNSRIMLTFMYSYDINKSRLTIEPRIRKILEARKEAQKKKGKS